MSRIYTRTGDKGTTGIHGGSRVPKDDIRIEANGTLDELNCQIGAIRSLLAEPDSESDALLHDIQKNLMAVMSLVATPSEERDKNPNRLPENLVGDCEAAIDSIAEETGPAMHFLLPGGTPLAAQLQLARAVCRRAERRLWTLHRQDPLPEAILQYINRLSDLLFIMARRELALQNWPEERWKAFAYKNQR
ncbi:MAG: cob(I)yrinic acid a,c-diamide adenosyltransferase [Bacteroidales bacterium]|nr:cob(I)yrinic acid a,c-diamide adenosyltransferase [Bacteroidales bacterium]